MRAWLPVLIAIAVIALESTDLFGADRTSAPLRWLYEHLLGPVGDQRWKLIHHYIRKTGHFTGYGIIGLTWLRAWWMTAPRWGFWRCSLMAVLGTVLIASSDEFHQTFLPNRTGLFSDVVLDTCGAVVLQLLAFLAFRLLQPRTA